MQNQASKFLVSTNMKRPIPFQQITDINEALAEGPHIMYIAQIIVPSTRCVLGRTLRVHVLEFGEFLGG